MYTHCISSIHPFSVVQTKASWCISVIYYLLVLEVSGDVLLGPAASGNIPHKPPPQDVDHRTDFDITAIHPLPIFVHVHTECTRTSIIIILLIHAILFSSC